MKWIPLIIWPILIIFSPNLPAVEHEGSGIEQEQNPRPTEEENHQPKKTLPLKLEETELGQALENADLTAYRKAMSALKQTSFEEASKVLTAIDKNGNNILHRIAQMEEPKDGFLAEAQSLATNLFLLGEGEILDKLLNTGNRENRTPKEIFKDTKNHIAVEYFVEMENLTKLQKKTQSADTNPTEKSYLSWAEIEDMLTEKNSHPIKKRRFRSLVNTEMFENKFIWGGLILLQGSIFVRNGLDMLISFPEVSSYYGSTSLAMGVSQIAIGGVTCYQAFKTKSLLNKTSNSQNPSP